MEVGIASTVRRWADPPGSPGSPTTGAGIGFVEIIRDPQWWSPHLNGFNRSPSGIAGLSGKVTGAGETVRQRARFGMVGTIDRSIYRKMGIARINCIKYWFIIGLLMKMTFSLTTTTSNNDK